MLTRTDIATLDPRYRSFRAELRYKTARTAGLVQMLIGELYLRTLIRPEALARWMAVPGNANQLAQRWVATNPNGSTTEYHIFLREQYARAHGLFR